MESLPVNLTDLIVLAILLVSGIIAFALGFVRVLLLIGAWIGAAIVTLHGFSSVSPIVRRHIDVPLLADIVAGVALFVVSLVVLFLVAMAVSAAVRRLGLGALDRALKTRLAISRSADWVDTVARAEMPGTDSSATVRPTPKIRPSTMVSSF